MTDNTSPRLARTVHVGGVRLDNHAPLAVIGGVNVLENLDVALRVADRFKTATRAYGMGYIFKASFDKANRSSYESYRGPGLQDGLKMLSEVKKRLEIPVLTDVHESNQCEVVANVADMLQIPAFLSRQTDLLVAAAQTGKPVHVKKMQSMAPGDMKNVRDKFARLGGREIVLCERGTSFGYNRLIVDPLGFSELKQLECPVTFDVSHSLQLPGALGAATGGRGEKTQALAWAGISQGLAGIFVEAHPEPTNALCDGPCAIPMSEIDALLRRAKVLDDLIKSVVFE